MPYCIINAMRLARPAVTSKLSLDFQKLQYPERREP